MPRLNTDARHHLINAAKQAAKASSSQCPADQGRALLNLLSHYHSALSAVLGVSDDDGAADPTFLAYEKQVRRYVNAGIDFVEEPITD